MTRAMVSGPKPLLHTPPETHNLNPNWQLYTPAVAVHMLHFCSTSHGNVTGATYILHWERYTRARTSERYESYE